ncbi:uncharacterized protein METZ01_LOCUS330793, partial [marine metagenome]
SGLQVLKLIPLWGRSLTEAFEERHVP